MTENLLNTLETGHIIEIEEIAESGDVKILKSEILEVTADNKCLIAIPFYKGRFYPLKTGERYRFYYNKRDLGVYQFVGLILSRQIEGKEQSLTILRVSEFIKSQRRLYYRLAVLIDAVILKESGRDIDKVINQGILEQREVIRYDREPCIVKDISGGGLKLQTSCPYPVESTLICQFTLGTDTFTLTSIVKRCFRIKDIIERYDVGVAFTALEETDRSKIIAFIFDKQRTLLKKGLI